MTAVMSSLIYTNLVDGRGRMTEPKATKRLVYECNRKKCEKCLEECSLTTDKEYAVEGDDGSLVTAIWEEEVPNAEET